MKNSNEIESGEVFMLISTSSKDDYDSNCTLDLQANYIPSMIESKMHSIVKILSLNVLSNNDLTVGTNCTFCE